MNGIELGSYGGWCVQAEEGRRDIVRVSGRGDVVERRHMKFVEQEAAEEVRGV